MKHSLVLYIHGKGGNAQEAAFYRDIFPASNVIGLEYRADTPWDFIDETQQFVHDISLQYQDITLIANSIGAFFAMNALSSLSIKKAYFISPIVNMERLIADMMTWANVSEQQLEQQKTIATAFDETLSWEYLTYVRTHPIIWNIDTEILYGEKDNLTAFETITAFADRVSAELTVMPNGEHWFHTQEQMDFLKHWITQKIR